MTDPKTHTENPGTDRVILVDKPLHWTSFDVVRKLRGGLRIKKIGHAGTLDPLATGLLIVCSGAFTKKINIYQEQEKEYTGTLKLGETTPSYDGETDVVPGQSWDHVTQEDLLEAAALFTGTISQIPPVYSAIKVDGQRSFDLARKGKAKELKSREVNIYTFEITAIRMPEVDFRVVCSKGTYIRSLAHDLGQKLGCGAWLTALRRTRIGEFRVEHALDPAQIIALEQV